MVVWKRCSKCKELKELNDLNFQSRTNRGGWHSACRDCLLVIRKAAYEAKIGHPARVPETRLVGNKTERTEDAMRRHQIEVIRPLIRRYEAARNTPGVERDAAGAILAMALQRHTGPIECDGRLYRWSRERDDIIRMKAEPRKHPPKSERTKARRKAEETLASVSVDPANPGND